MRIKAKISYAVEYTFSLNQREGRDTRGMNWVSEEEHKEAESKINDYLRKHKDVDMSGRYGIDRHTNMPGDFEAYHGLKLPAATRQTHMKYVRQFVVEMVEALGMEGVWVNARSINVGEIEIDGPVGTLAITFNFNVFSERNAIVDDIVSDVEALPKTLGGNFLDLKDFKSEFLEVENESLVFEGTATVGVHPKYLSGSSIDMDRLADDIGDTLFDNIKSLSPGARGAGLEDISNAKFNAARTASIQAQLIRLGASDKTLRHHIRPILDHLHRSARMEGESLAVSYMLDALEKVKEAAANPTRTSSDWDYIEGRLSSVTNLLRRAELATTHQFTEYTIEDLREIISIRMRQMGPGGNMDLKGLGLKKELQSLVTNVGMVISEVITELISDGVILNPKLEGLVNKAGIPGRFRW